MLLHPSGALADNKKGLLAQALVLADSAARRQALTALAVSAYSSIWSKFMYL